MLNDVSQRHQKASLFGNEYDSVFGIAPVGLGALYRYRGDIELATAARIRNVPYVLSGASLTPLEEDRKSVVSGKSVSVRVDLGGRRIIKKKKKCQYNI